MKRKKVFSLLLACTLVGSMIAGCGGKAPETQAPKPDEGQTQESQQQGGEESFEGQTLTLAHNFLDGTKGGFDAEFAAFEEKYGCKIEVELWPENADECENLRLTRAATGNLPDVFASSSGAKLLELSPTDNLMDISGNAAIVDRLTEEFKMVVDGDNGEIYGVPLGPANVAGVFYNKNVYKDLGLEIPETWDEFLANCEKIKNETDADPVVGAYDGAAGRQILFLSQYFYVTRENEDFASQYQNKEVELHESDAYMRGLTKLYDIWEKGYLNDDPLATSFEDSAIAVAQGTAVHTFARTNLVGTAMNTVGDEVENMGFFPLPDIDAEDRGVAVWIPQTWCISKNAANPELAIKFFEFLVSDEGLAAYCEGVQPTGAFAIVGSSLPDDVATPIKEAQEWVNKASVAVMEYYCDIKGANMSTILSMVGTGEIDPEEGIKQIEEDNAIDAQQKGLAGW